MTPERLKLFRDWHLRLAVDLRRESEGDVELMAWAQIDQATADEMTTRVDKMQESAMSLAMRRFDSAVTAHAPAVWK